MHIPSGEDIPIEERDPNEVLKVFGQSVTTSNVKVWNPSFDVTPAHLITAIITEKKVYRSPYSFTV